MIEHPAMSCKLSAKFSWTDLDTANKWSRQQEALKLSTHMYEQGGSDVATYPSSVFSTRLRVPGSGNTMVLRYEGGAGKPFKFLGLDTTFTTRTEK